MVEELGARRRLHAGLTGVCALALVLVGCGSSTTGSALFSSAAPAASCPEVQTASFDKTKFVLHAGLGFGAFHHFIYKPFRSGEFSSGSRGRARHLAEAGLAAAFTVHELRLAKQDAEANPTLCRVVAAPLDSAAGSLQLLDNRLSSGQAGGSDLDQVNRTIDEAQHGSAQAGIPVTDQIPSVQQLAHPS
ncbi:MAG: hypothetical protein ACRDRI_05500 [Pseudonocardiaceae bacterium]